MKSKSWLAAVLLTLTIKCPKYKNKNFLCALGVL